MQLCIWVSFVKGEWIWMASVIIQYLICFGKNSREEPVSARTPRFKPQWWQKLANPVNYRPIVAAADNNGKLFLNGNSKSDAIYSWLCNYLPCLFNCRIWYAGRVHSRKGSFVCQSVCPASFSHVNAAHCPDAASACFRPSVWGPRYFLYDKSTTDRAIHTSGDWA